MTLGFNSARKNLALGIGEKGKSMSEGTCYEKLRSLLPYGEGGVTDPWPRRLSQGTGSAICGGACPAPHTGTGAHKKGASPQRLRRYRHVEGP